MAKMQTLGEMEAEDPNVFKNPTKTPEEEARHNAIVKAKREYEAIHTQLDDGSADDDEESEEDDDAE